MEEREGEREGELNEETQSFQSAQWLNETRISCVRNDIFDLISSPMRNVFGPMMIDEANVFSPSSRLNLELR